MASQLIGHAWITGRDCIGVVLTFDLITQTFKGRIGVVDGNGEQTDMLKVQSTGSYLAPHIAIPIVRTMGRFAKISEAVHTAMEAIVPSFR